ncbi:uncharacterized protein LOC129581012 [Paramacrobiotus metropolitanus]|uniref:uncharacterized protein LOC129581012 n=1 Tax=Paramacrobiotus metropolitanus TaxID=2943436 RepID=UPI00244589A6|nr:uncharacterized protein LOC129581012 [Paramacrobiotus metropolitanus]
MRSDRIRMILGAVHIIYGFCFIALQIIVEITSAAFYTQNTAEDFFKAGFALGGMDWILAAVTLVIFCRDKDSRGLRVAEMILTILYTLLLICYLGIRFQWFVEDPDWTDNFTDCHFMPTWPKYYLWNRPPHCSAYWIKAHIMWITIGIALADLITCFAGLVMVRVVSNAQERNKI